MKVVNGARDQLERDLACEIFSPTDNRERVAELIYQLAPRGLQIYRLYKKIASGFEENRKIWLRRGSGAEPHQTLSLG